MRVNTMVRISVNTCLFANPENAETCLSASTSDSREIAALSLLSILELTTSSTTKAGLKSFSMPRNDNGSRSPLKQREREPVIKTRWNFQLTSCPNDERTSETGSRQDTMAKTLTGRTHLDAFDVPRDTDDSDGEEYSGT